MRKRQKRWLAVAAGLALMGSMTACGGKNGSGATESVLSSSQGRTEGTQVLKEVQEVVFWHSFSGATEEALVSIINGYNEGRGKEKGIHATLVYQGYEGTDKVILAYQTKDYDNAPDINVGLTSTIPAVMDMDWSVPAEEFLKAPESEVSKDTFYEALQRACSYEDQMAAVPFSNSIPLLYYNKAVLEEAGYEKAPETMDQLAEYVKALTLKEGNQVTRYGLNMQVKRYHLVEFCVSQGTGTFFGDQEGGRKGPMTRITAGEDGTMKAFLEKLEVLLNTGGYKYVEDNINEEFAQGLSAMVIMSSSRMGTLDKLMPGEYMTAYLPKVNEGDQGGAAVGGSCLNLFNRGSEERLKAAWDVIEYCVSPESQYIFSTASGYIPVNIACEELEEMKAYYEEKPQYKMALEEMKSSPPLSQEPLDLVYNEINGIITETMLKFCQGDLSVKETVEKITSACNEALAEYHEVND